MIDGTVQRVAVIGGGVAGLVSAKVLKRDGFAVTVYEKAPTVGGVWAASRSYPGLRTNNPRETYVFSDFPYPERTDEFPTAAQVRNYLESYAGHFGLTSHIRTAVEVLSVGRRTPENDESRPGFQVTVKPVGGSANPETHDFDFVVVCNGVFSEPYVPQLDGQDDFAGQVLHSSEVHDEQMLRDKRVVVVGAGKSALDCATIAGSCAASCTLVFRTPHWMLPRYFGRTRVDRVVFTRFSELLLPAYHGATRVETVLRTAAAPLLWLTWRARSRLVRRLNRMPDVMVPDQPLPSGIETIGIGGEIYRALRQETVHASRARIVSFPDDKSILLDTGKRLDADVVIFATGWRRNVALLDPALRREIQREDQFHLFRLILAPREPRLGFVGYASSSASPLVSEISAHWLSQCFQGRLSLPSTARMEQEIARVQRWMAEVFPGRREGYFIGAYISHYVDELLCDMGLTTRRRNSLFAEYLAPFWSERYRDLEKERYRAGK